MTQAERIVHFCTRAGIDKRALADIVGVSTQAVRAWWAGEYPPTQRNLELIVQACGINLSTFWGPIGKRGAA